MPIRVEVFDTNPREPRTLDYCDTFLLEEVNIPGSWYPWKWSTKKYVLLYSSPRHLGGENFGQDFDAARKRQLELVEELKKS